MDYLPAIRTAKAALEYDISEPPEGLSEADRQDQQAALRVLARLEAQYEAWDSVSNDRR